MGSNKILLEREHFSGNVLMSNYKRQVSYLTVGISNLTFCSEIQRKIE